MAAEGDRAGSTWEFEDQLRALRQPRFQGMQQTRVIARIF
jgi:hypothetical protein